MDSRITPIKTFSISAIAILFGLSTPPANAEAEQKKAASTQGAELFAREWLPGDTRSKAGDGLGPLFNETSCLSCHNQGGPGGGGPAGKNVEIISVFPSPVFAVAPTRSAPPLQPQNVPQASQPSFQSPQRSPQTVDAVRQQQQEAMRLLAKMHPGFQKSRSVVLHRYGSFAGYQTWRNHLKSGSFQNTDSDRAMVLLGVQLPDDGVLAAQSSPQGTSIGLPPSSIPIRAPSSLPGPVQATSFAQVTPMAGPIHAVNSGTASIFDDMNSLRQNVRTRSHAKTRTIQMNGFALSVTQRNPTALFGAGLIDTIPATEIEAGAKRRNPDFPEIRGRVSRLKDGRIGRFGWKAQTASLADFTLTACSVELGLNVPEHPQSGIPQRPDYQPVGLDLSQDECDALIKYIADLPAPMQSDPASEENAAFIHAGAAQLKRIGCTSCHVADLGKVAGIYSDLMLHNMGPDLGDTGDYGVFIPDESPDDPLPSSEEDEQKKEAQPAPQPLATVKGATRLEWRTPPLWGLRDSAPYMHDGRADTLEEAIALHGGEAARSAQMYFALLPKERIQVLAMLRSLVAPQSE